LKLKRAIEEYRQRLEANKRLREKIKVDCTQRISRRKKELLKRISSLEKKKLPKDIDENLRKRILSDRKKYVSALRRALENVKTIEDLGKRLPELAKLHVDHGRYLAVVFEKEIYAINKLLKEMNQDYVEYVDRVEKTALSEINPMETMEKIRRIREQIKETRKELEDLKSLFLRKKSQLKRRAKEEGIEDLKKEIEAITREKKSVELEIRSKVSKLQKPLKRMRLGGLADKVARDSAIVFERPKEFLKLLGTLKERFQEKGRKTIDWLLENLEEKLENINTLEEELEAKKGLLTEKEKLLEELEREISELERKKVRLETRIKKLERKLDYLSERLHEEIRVMESVLGEKIEVDF